MTIQLFDSGAYGLLGQDFPKKDIFRKMMVAEWSSSNDGLHDGTLQEARVDQLLKEELHVSHLTLLVVAV